MTLTQQHLKPIETRYAGCRFRSRLEARWAVAFDYLGVRWEYEPQGVEVSNRLLLPDLPRKWAYLPDFWLPEFNLWAEVKGSLRGDDLSRFLSAAASLSSNDGGGCHDNGGYDVILLGPIPQARDRSARPVRLHMHKGDLEASGFHMGDLVGHAGEAQGDVHAWGHATDFCVARDSGEIFWSADVLLAGWPDKVGRRVADAYTAARSARFEHGERD